MAAAFILYYLDRYYGLGYIVTRAENELEHLRANIKVDKADEKSPIDNLWVFVLSLLIITFLFAVKRVFDRRN